MAFEKLKRKSAPATEAPAEEEKAPAKKPGWGKVAAKKAEETVDEDEQRAAIQEKLQNGKPRAVTEPEEDEGEDDAPVDAKSAFSKDVQDALDGEEAGDDEQASAPKTKRKATKKKSAASKTSFPPSQFNVEVEVSTSSEGDPLPRVRAYFSVTDTVEEDGAVRQAEVVAAAAEAAYKTLVDE